MKEKENRVNKSSGIVNPKIVGGVRGNARKFDERRRQLGRSAGDDLRYFRTSDSWGVTRNARKFDERRR